MTYQLSLAERILAFVIFVVLRLIGATYRFKITGEDNFSRAKATHAQGSCAIMLWHENIFASLVFFLGHKLAPLASHSKDGAMITAVMDWIGFRTVRGSSSKGGAQARDDLVAAVGDGFSPVLTVDGPRGPRRVAKSGVIDVARRSGVVVVPFAAVAKSSWVLRSWDRFRIPKPFAQIEVVFGAPIEIPADATGTAFGKFRAEAQDALMQTQLTTEARAGVTAPL